MIKKIIISFFILFHTSAFAENILTVGTYDSFAADWGPGPNIEDEFEKTKRSTGGFGHSGND